MPRYLPCDRIGSTGKPRRRRRWRNLGSDRTRAYPYNERHGAYELDKTKRREPLGPGARVCVLRRGPAAVGYRQEPQGPVTMMPVFGFSSSHGLVLAACTGATVSTSC